MQVVFFLLFVLLVIVGAALLYTSQDRRGIRKNFSALMKRVPGTLKAGNPFTYPEAQVDYQGRKVTVYFHIHEIHRTSFLLVVYRTPLKTDGTLLLLKKDFFKRIQDEDRLSKEVGAVIPDLENGYVVRAKDAGAARTLLQDGAVRGGLKKLDAFSNILMDSGMLLISKPFDGMTQDTTPDRIMENMGYVNQLASAMEGVSQKGS
jgi:hypothetical protein